MILLFRENFRRAALYSAALLLLATPVWAALIDVKSKKSETSVDIIEKAYNLSLQKADYSVCFLGIKSPTVNVGL